MKKLYIIFLVLLTSLSSYAQDPQLFENDWYLQNVIIDGQDNFPPSNNEVSYVSISFFQNNSFVNTSVCDWLDGTLIFINSQFTFDSWSTSFGGCSGPFAQENLLFQGIYLGTFYQNNINDSFLYNITGEGNNKTLMIISSSGDEAIYSSVLLSTQDYLVNSFSFYPNPVKELLIIENNTGDAIITLQVYDVLGKLVLAENNPTNQSNVSTLKRGVFFIKITTAQGSLIKKMVKE